MPPTDPQPRVLAWSVRNYFRFSLSAIFLCISGIAVFLGVRNFEGTVWSDPWQAVATMFMVTGLVAQVADLRRAKGEVSDTAGCNRIVWEQLWRLVAASLLVLFLVENIVQHCNFQYFRVADIGYGIADLPSAGWHVIVFVALQPPRKQPINYQSSVRRCLAITGLSLGCAFAFILISEWSIIEILAQMAIRGVELAQPSRRSGHAIHDYQFYFAQRQQLQFAAPMAAGTLWGVIVAGWLSLQVRSHWARWLISILAIFGLAGLTCATIWAHQTLWSIQPFRSLSSNSYRPYFLANEALVFALLVVTTTLVLLRDSRVNFESSQVLNWRRPFGGYAHERWYSLAILGVGTLGPFVSFIADGVRSWFSSELDFSPWWEEWYWPPFQFSILSFWILLGCYWRLFRSADGRNYPPLILTPLRWQLALAIGVFLAVLIPVAIHVATWLNWVLWMEPRWV